MATRLAWWTIPATFVVLTRVVTLPSDPSTHQKPETVDLSAAAESYSTSDTVVLRDAAGLRRGAFELKMGDALVLQLPIASTCVDFTLHRYLPHTDDPSLWLHATPQVTADGTLPILGLPVGRYSAHLRWTEAGVEHTIVRDDLTVPGTFDLRN